MRAFALAIAAVASLSGSPNVGPTPSTGGNPDVRPTVRQLAGQRVVFPFAGRTPPPALLRRIRRGEAAGVLFLGGNLGTAAEVRALTARLRAAAGGRGLLLMVDQEGGSVKRLPGAPSRSAPQMAATGRPSVARAEGRATARTLRAAGMNVDLAPVVDVVRPESALQSEGRGFGYSASTASRFGAAFARGLADGRVAAAAKHFPGFGAAVANTDDGAVRIAVDKGTLQRVDRRPFAAAIGAGVPLVMLASAIYPALSAKPAVLSKAVVQGRLRRDLRFGGVTISDDLAAPAFAAHGGPSGAGVGAARAGVDLLLYAGTYEAADRAANALEAAIRSGAVDRDEATRAVSRVRALRARLR